MLNTEIDVMLQKNFWKQVHGPDFSENEKVRWSTGTDCPDRRIFNSFQLTDRMLSKMDSNTLFFPPFLSFLQWSR